LIGKKTVKLLATESELRIDSKKKESELRIITPKDNTYIN
jgi:hypothetical protein